GTRGLSRGPRLAPDPGIHRPGPPRIGKIRPGGNRESRALIAWAGSGLALTTRANSRLHEEGAPLGSAGRLLASSSSGSIACAIRHLTTRSGTEAPHRSRSSGLPDRARPAPTRRPWPPARAGSPRPHVLASARRHPRHAVRRHRG